MEYWADPRITRRADLRTTRRVAFWADCWATCCFACRDASRTGLRAIRPASSEEGADGGNYMEVENFNKGFWVWIGL